MEKTTEVEQEKKGREGERQKKTRDKWQERKKVSVKRKQ